MFDTPDKTAIVAHDAGAANIIIAWIDAGLLPQERVYLEGPAATLWDSRARRSRLPSLDAAFEGAQALITGTGWGSDLEHAARRIARKRELRSIAVLDHWVNYAVRFERAGETLLPDEIWVTDEYAEAMARDVFPGLPLHRAPNTYLSAEVGRITEPRDGRELLYILEPARSDWGRDKLGEFQALDFFVERLGELKLPGETRLRLRPHPSDPAGKYDEWIARHNHLDIEMAASEPLSDAISRASTVVGCNSFALVVALAAGRRVVCTLPPWAPACYLPHRGLIQLKDLA